MELVCAISIGLMVTLMASTVMIVGLRMYSSSRQTGQHQGQVMTAITAMENLVADSTNITVDGSEIRSNGSALIARSGDTLVNAGNGTILEGVEEFTVSLQGSLLSVDMKVWGEGYTFLIMVPGASGGSLTNFSGIGAKVFLQTLYSQLGTAEAPNMGYINGDPDGLRYATWYNSAWGAEAAWCSCFVSWGLEQCRGYIAGPTPKYASVNSFMQYLINTDAYKTSNPQPGDLIFFNWDAGNEKDDGRLDHVGVVTRVDITNGYVYTIEGNSGGSTNANGSVREKRYRISNPHIHGYGRINWIG